MGDVLRAAFGVLERLNRFVYYLIGALLAVISVVVLIQVLVRFVLTSLGINIAAPWTEELARYLLVWLIFLGAAVGCRHMQLISLDFVMKWLPAPLGKAARYLAFALCFWMFVLMIQYGIQFVMVIGRSELSPVMQIPKEWVYWAMPVGAGLMLVNTLAFLVEIVRDGKDIRYVGGFGDGE